MLGLFEQLRVQDDKVRDWFANALRACSRGQQDEAAEKLDDLQRQVTRLSKQKDQLLAVVETLSDTPVTLEGNIFVCNGA